MVVGPGWGSRAANPRPGRAAAAIVAVVIALVGGAAVPHGMGWARPAHAQQVCRMTHEGDTAVAAEGVLRMLGEACAAGSPLDYRRVDGPMREEMVARICDRRRAVLREAPDRIICIYAGPGAAPPPGGAAR